MSNIPISIGVYQRRCVYHCMTNQTSIPSKSLLTALHSSCDIQVNNHHSRVLFLSLHQRGDKQTDIPPVTDLLLVTFSNLLRYNKYPDKILPIYNERYLFYDQRKLSLTI